MKHCPQCDSVFADHNRFCDLDGTPLVEADRVHGEPDSQPGDNWKILAMGAVAGLAIGVVLFLIYYGVTRQRQPDNSHVSSGATGTQAPPALLRSEPVPSTAATSDSSPSPSPSPSASLLPSPQPSETVKLSSSPISTGVTAKTGASTSEATAKNAGPATIKLKNGASIETDEVWEGVEGIWYRRRGIVALLDRAQVKAIERPSPAGSPSPTPTVR